MNESVIMPAVVAGYAPRRDGSFSIRFETNELTPQEVANLHAMHNQFGLMYFRMGETLTKSEIKELDQIDVDQYEKPKTQGQRIRNHLYILWTKDNHGFDDFKAFYQYSTEKIIDQLKDKINKLE